MSTHKQKADALAQAVRDLINALEYQENADSRISNEEGATDEQEEAVLDAMDHAYQCRIQARKALADYEAAARQDLPSLNQFRVSGEIDCSGTQPTEARDAVEPINALRAAITKPMLPDPDESEARADWMREAAKIVIELLDKLDYSDITEDDIFDAFAKPAPKASPPKLSAPRATPPNEVTAKELIAWLFKINRDYPRNRAKELKGWLAELQAERAKGLRATREAK